MNIKKAFPFKIKAEWVVLALVTGVLFYSHLYWDIIITTRHGINVWYSLFDGRIFDFYFDNVNPPVSNFATSSAIYPFTVYVVFAVWNFPLWLAERFFGFDPFMSTAALMYGKSILIPFLLGCGFMVYKICTKLEMGKTNSKWCAYFFLSSALVFFSLAVTGQYDIFSLFFILLGLYFYLEKKYIGFIIFFGIAITLKMFALFIFIPLVLLYEKRIYVIAANLIGGITFYFFLSAAFVIPDGSTAIMNRMIGYLFSSTLPLTYVHTPIFVILTILLWIFCYIAVPLENEAERGEIAVYAAFLSMAVLFVACYTHLYWIILMSPFMSILCFICLKNKRHTRAVFLIETMASGAVVFALNILGTPVFSMYTINSAVLPTLFGEVQGEINLAQILAERLGENGSTFLGFIPASCTAAFVAGIIALSVICYRKNGNKKTPAADGFERTENIESKLIEPPKDIIWGRLALNSFICGVPVLCYFYLLLSQ
ncbi:MAG: hypothetical protein FWH07_02020 [Oscillospiraceae bacterium]|nr:hypothetical protein [Oscillospiraceae bacterium]